MQSKLPTKFSYQVTDTFFAGEYPFRITQKEGLPKLKELLDFGIKHFIDLTSERLTKYSKFLPQHCSYTNLPTIDYTSPDFPILKEIHARIDEAESLGEKIYVHCKGGHDRTGVVVATYFIHAGISPALAKQKFYEVFVSPVRGRYPHYPLIETKWEILEQYQEWLAGFNVENSEGENEKTPVEINHAAVRVLFEGLNGRGLFRRVIYYPYMDNYVTLLITDIDGNVMQQLTPEYISREYLPKEYWNDVPEDYTWGWPDPNDR